MQTNQGLTNQGLNNKKSNKKLIFRKFTTERCKVYNSDGYMIGEIQRKRIKYYMRWMFCPISVDKLGYLNISQSELEEIIDEIKKIRKQKRVQ